MAITVAGVKQDDAFYGSLGLISVSYLFCFFCLSSSLLNIGSLGFYLLDMKWFIRYG
jgi:hypothetical protein